MSSLGNYMDSSPAPRTIHHAGIIGLVAIFFANGACFFANSAWAESVALVLDVAATGVDARVTWEWRPEVTPPSAVFLTARTEQGVQVAIEEVTPAAIQFLYSEKSSSSVVMETTLVGALGSTQIHGLQYLLAFEDGAGGLLSEVHPYHLAPMTTPPGTCEYRVIDGLRTDMVVVDPALNYLLDTLDYADLDQALQGLLAFPEGHPQRCEIESLLDQLAVNNQLAGNKVGKKAALPVECSVFWQAVVTRSQETYTSVQNIIPLEHPNGDPGFTEVRGPRRAVFHCLSAQAVGLPEASEIYSAAESVVGNVSVEVDLRRRSGPISCEDNCADAVSFDAAYTSMAEVEAEALPQNLPLLAVKGEADAADWAWARVVEVGTYSVQGEVVLETALESSVGVGPMHRDQEVSDVRESLRSAPLTPPALGSLDIDAVAEAHARGGFWAAFAFGNKYQIGVATSSAMCAPEQALELTAAPRLDATKLSMWPKHNN